MAYMTAKANWNMQITTNTMMTILRLAGEDSVLMQTMTTMMPMRVRKVVKRMKAACPSTTSSRAAWVLSPNSTAKPAAV